MPLNDEIQVGKETLLQSVTSKNQIRRLEVIFEKLFFFHIGYCRQFAATLSSNPKSGVCELIAHVLLRDKLVIEVLDPHVTASGKLNCSCLRDWSLIMGMGGFQNGKISGLKLFAPPSRQGKTFHAPPPLQRVETFYAPPPSIWLKPQATA